jgi:hypothetical protein
MKARYAIGVVIAAGLVASVARSGHELPVYPSYYPHEIEIKTIAPVDAGDLLRAGKLHAYVGGAPIGSRATPGSLGAVESLGSFVVVRINPASRLAGDAVSACAAIAAVVRDMATRADGTGFTVHPYPVTPWHGDYLNHADRAEEASQRILLAAAPLPVAGLKLRADGALAKSLISPERLTDEPIWDAAVEQVDVSRLAAEATIVLNGWLGPRWVRSGWFHAYRVLGSAVHDPADKQKLQASVARLQAGDYQETVERINLERAVVQSLTSGCRAMIAGYTARREFFNTEFSAGIENLSFDAIEGFSSPMFLRTVKLKDFPWNGSLQLGVAAHPDAAWNPVGGFGDPFGRLAWYAIADPAVIPSPYEAGWMLNRISDVEISPRQ